MAPLVHGGIYPETEGVTLGSRELRILIDPEAVSAETAEHLREIDVLRHSATFRVSRAPSRFSPLRGRVRMSSSSSSSGFSTFRRLPSEMCLAPS